MLDMTTSTEQMYDDQARRQLGFGDGLYILDHGVSPQPGPSSLPEPLTNVFPSINGHQASASTMDWETTPSLPSQPVSSDVPIDLDQVQVGGKVPETLLHNGQHMAMAILQHGSGSKKQIMRLKLSQPKPVFGAQTGLQHQYSATSFHDQHGLPSYLMSTTHPRIKLEEDVNNSSDSFGGTSRISDFDSENRSTPNDSMTSISVNGMSHPESSSPATSFDRVHKSTVFGVQSDVDLLIKTKFRPRSSIPTGLPAGVYGQQCVAAAYASRLNPYALHADEHRILRDRLCHLHITVYLNLRNGILRLWTRNPLVSVTREEALGCAKDHRWVHLASFAYDWLARKGYINFGCVEIPGSVKSSPRRARGKLNNPRTVVVIGAGMSGLGCARQLQGLFNQYHNRFSDEQPMPRIVILEARKRIGGRIYSHPLKSMTSQKLKPGLRPTAEMGAQIITGFEHGNPLDAIVRGQLALHYHSLKDVSTLYDIDGSPVDESHDLLVEKLYNDILDRSGLYRHKANIPVPAEGDRELIDSARDSSADDGVTIAQFEEAKASGTIDLILPRKTIRKGVGHKAAAVKNTPTSLNQNTAPTSLAPAATEALGMGWRLKPGIPTNQNLALDDVARSSNFQTLGSVMDEGVSQYQGLVNLTPKDMRLMNWHFANLEYANAANIGKLSLASWDQDTGNEFEGEHAEVVGGYQQVPRGIMTSPTRLDVRTGKVISRISYHEDNNSTGKTKITCEDGETIHADKIVLTAPLGVMKDRSIQFDPPLPEWKTGAIDRLGFGLLNKVVLVFQEPFWDVDRDMFGVLRGQDAYGSLRQEDYISGRGQFYLFWNIIKTSGLPVLVALMAGDAAHEAELRSDDDLIGDCLGQLRNIFGPANVPMPAETIVTRWKSDRFARGSYSYVAAQARPGDYDLMAKRIGNLYFAGEATCGTHPATVHGAYLSGLRVASEVLESLIGAMENDIPIPLVAPKIKAEFAPISSIRKKAPTSAIDVIPVISNDDLHHRRASYEAAIQAAILTQLGPRPAKPSKSGINPFLLYQKDHWAPCKAQCDAARQAATNNPEAKAGRDEVRAALGLMWRNAPEEEKKPYIDQTMTNRQVSHDLTGGWKEKTQEWEGKARAIREEWVGVNPFESFGLSGEVVANFAEGSAMDVDGKEQKLSY
jgi:monoamine oxidase